MFLKYVHAISYVLLETLANKIAGEKGFLLAHGFRGSLGPSYQNILAVGMWGFTSWDRSKRDKLGNSGRAWTRHSP